MGMGPADHAAFQAAEVLGLHRAAQVVAEGLCGLLLGLLTSLTGLAEPLIGYPLVVHPRERSQTNPGSETPRGMPCRVPFPADSVAITPSGRLSTSERKSTVIVPQFPAPRPGVGRASRPGSWRQQDDHGTAEVVATTPVATSGWTDLAEIRLAGQRWLRQQHGPVAPPVMGGVR